MGKKFHRFDGKIGWVVFLFFFVFLFAAILSDNQLANASSLLFGREPTLTNQERKLKQIEEVNERIKNETNPTVLAVLNLQLKSAELDATSEAVAETLIPTYNVISRTENAISTEKAKNTKQDMTPRLATLVGGPTVYTDATDRDKNPATENSPHNLLPGETGLTVPFPMPNQNEAYEFTTVWVESVDVLHSILFYAGGIKGTNQGIIYWSDGLSHKDNVFIMDGVGKLTVVDKQDNFLVLKSEMKDELYFDTMTMQFTTSKTGTIPPITTILPTQTALPTQIPSSQDIPVHPYP